MTDGDSSQAALELLSSTVSAPENHPFWILLTSILVRPRLSDAAIPLNSLCIFPLFRYSAPLPHAKSTFRYPGNRRERHGHRDAALSIPRSRLQDGNAECANHAGRPGGYRIDCLPALGVANPLCRYSG